MPYNFTPLEYNPYSFTTGSNYPAHDPYGDQDRSAWLKGQDAHARGQIGANLGEYQGYAGDQFSGLTDAVNELGSNPMVTGSAFTGTPQYSPYAGNRAVFTQDGVFDQQGYLDARFNNINSYLNNLGSFIGGLSGDQQVQTNQAQIARDLYQASLPQIQSVQPLQQSAYTGGGWGQQAPTPQTAPMTYRGQSPGGILGTTNRGSHGGILGGNE